MHGIARHHYEEALAAWPAMSSTEHRLAKAVLGLGDLDGALLLLQQAVEHGPFEFGPMIDLASLLHHVGRRNDCVALCREALLLIAACPAYEPYRPVFEKLNA
jgi:hypothetical protein